MSNVNSCFVCKKQLSGFCNEEKIFEFKTAMRKVFSTRIHLEKNRSVCDKCLDALKAAVKTKDKAFNYENRIKKLEKDLSNALKDRQHYSKIFRRKLNIIVDLAGAESRREQNETKCELENVLEEETQNLREEQEEVGRKLETLKDWNKMTHFGNKVDPDALQLANLNGSLATEGLVDRMLDLLKQPKPLALVVEEGSATPAFIPDSQVTQTDTNGPSSKRLRPQLNPEVRNIDSLDNSVPNKIMPSASQINPNGNDENQVSTNENISPSLSPANFASNQGRRNELNLQTKFKCSFCRATFSRKGNKETHERTHMMGESPFQCRYCDLEFKVKGSLTIHERYHTGVKPFVCAVCNEAFAQFWDFSNHQKNHSGFVR